VVEALLEEALGVPRIGRALSAVVTTIGLTEVEPAGFFHRSNISQTQIPQTFQQYPFSIIQVDPGESNATYRHDSR